MSKPDTPNFGDDSAYKQFLSESERQEEITREYERSFGQFPARAEAARQLAHKVTQRIFTVLELGAHDVPTSDLDVEGLERTLSWAAFDYSRQEQDGQVIGLEIEVLAYPILAILYRREGRFLHVADDFRARIITMRHWRGAKKSDSPRRSGNDPSSVFVTDYEDTAELGFGVDNQ